MYHFSVVPNPPPPSSFVTRAPSFFCENETRHGLTLHYRTRRKGFVYYTMGQIRQVRNRHSTLHFAISISDGSSISTCHSAAENIWRIYWRTCRHREIPESQLVCLFKFSAEAMCWHSVFELI